MVQPINSAGYDGDMLDEDWANMAPFHGFAGRAAGLNQASLQVGVNPDTAAARSIIVAPGRWWADNVLDYVTGSVLLNFPSVTNSCYGAVVMRHDWRSQTSTLLALAGTSTPALPAFENTPGVVADSLLCLAGLDAGSSSIRTLLDRRTWVEGPALFPSYRQTDNPFLGLAEVCTINGAYLRAGEYLLTGVPSMSSAVTADGSVSLLASSFGDPDADLGGMAVHAPGGGSMTPTVQRPFTHKGGPLTVRLRASFPGVTVQAYTGSSLIAEFVKPV